MTVAFVFAVCLFASLIGGVCGVGGGILIKPVLDATGVMGVAEASFLSGLTVLAMALINVVKSRKSRELSPTAAIPLGIGAAIGGVLGKRAFDMARQLAGDDRLAGAWQAALLLAVVVGTFFYTLCQKQLQTRNIQNKVAGLLIGVALGAVSAFLGIGGGPMNLAALSFFFSMNAKKAAANSIFIILISQAASALFSLASASVPPIALAHLAAMVTAGALGGLGSAKLRERLSVSGTERLFRYLLCAIALVCVFNIIRLSS